jgi:tyrosine-protein kinase Etk/Wzc
LPPANQQVSNLASSLAQGDAAASLAASALKMRSQSELYGGILQSRTIADKVIDKFSLRARYGKQTMEETRKALGQRTSVKVGRDGLIQIEYEDEDAKLAAEVANAYVDALEQLTTDLAITEASQRRLFLEKQLSRAKDALTFAEAELIKIQAKTGLLVPEQVSAAANIRGQIVAKEVELVSLEAFATSQNPQLIKSKRELNELRGQLSKLERSPVQSDVFVALSRLPDAGMAYLTGMREMKYNERLFEFLARQLETAKLEEARDGTAIQVVDRAIIPDKKARPYRTMWVLATMFLSGLLACLYVIISHEIENGSATDKELVNALRAELRGLLPSFQSLLKRRAP